MNNSNDNRLISLARVVSVDAWYDRFSEDCKETELFLHVKFQDGVFGASPEHPVRFKIRLKNADISIVPEEPITVPKRHVRRDRIEVEAKQTTERRLAGNAYVEGVMKGEVSRLGPTGSIRGEAGGRAEVDGTDTTTVTKVSHSGMTIEHSTDVEGFNRWSFAPVAGPHLLGQAFNETEPLLKMTHEGALSTIPPVVKIQVSCLREDIDIVGLEVKEEKRTLLSKGMGEEQKLKLVEEMIKEALVEGGLSFEGDLDKVSSVQVADVIASEE